MPIMKLSRFALKPSHGAPHGRLLPRLFLSNRVQIPAMLLITVGLPELLRPFFSFSGPWMGSNQTEIEFSIMVSAACNVFAHVAIRHLSVLPLTSAKSLILPTLLTSYATGAATLYALKVGISHYHLWTAFLLGLIWFFAVNMYRVRQVVPAVAVIGVDKLDERLLRTNVLWVILKQPEIHHPIAAAVIDPHAELDFAWSRFVTKLVLDGTPVYHLSHIEEGLSGRVRFRSAADNEFGALLPSLTYLRLKRVLDFAGALALLPLLLPVLVVACLAIKMDSPGSLIFRQERIGHRGKSFTCFKLRTMTENASGPAFTRERDPRITRVGKYLRKWRIDELPQIYNVLRGDMSWIGPRPEARQLAEHYEALVPYYGYRHAVRPGITGWAAVHQGNVAELDAATVKLEYDFYYIRHFSVWLDFLIVLKTFQTIWTGFGSR